ncbi:MAG TPA: carboxypeptidase-like regulatory domain-containing protein [Puia sp.]|nr:carboxypeptidase-like regulatory domain-containing protein [Puia sp.]
MDFHAFKMDFRSVHVLLLLSVALGPGWTVLQMNGQVQQGIEGVARRPSGNRMPSPRVHRGLPAGVRATICVFRLTGQDQVTETGRAGLYSAVRTILVRQADTDDSGRFRILLPPGTYSVFTKKGPLFYATRRDEKNHIAPVTVLPGKMTRVDCSVESDHTAVY